MDDAGVNPVLHHAASHSAHGPRGVNIDPVSCRLLPSATYIQVIKWSANGSWAPPLPLAPSSRLMQVIAAYNDNNNNY